MKKLLVLTAALSLMVAACGGRAGGDGADDGGLSSPRAGPSSSGSSAADGEALDPAGDGAGASTTTPHSTRSETKSSGSSAGDTAQSDPAPDADDGGSARPQPAAPLPSGTYRYDTDGTVTLSGGSRAMPETTTLVVDAHEGSEQRAVRDLRDDEGSGSVTETRLEFRADGVYLAYVKVTSNFPGGLTDVREFRLAPPELIAATGAGPGFARSFRMEGSGTTAEVGIKALRTEKITIDGTTLRAVVVDTRIVFSGALEGEQTSTTWFWPKHLLPLKERVSSDVTNGPIRAQTDYEATLESLTP